MGWFQKLSAGLSKTRNAVTGQLDRLLGRAADPALLDELEIALISADLGLPVVERVMEQVWDPNDGPSGGPSWTEPKSQDQAYAGHRP